MGCKAHACFSHVKKRAAEDSETSQASPPLTVPCDNPQMIIMRESRYRAVPWKNGGGVTREVLRVPPEPTAFDWRLSLATIDSPGPFSCFDGYQRTLALVRGPGVELDFGQHGRTQLTRAGQMVSFDGAWAT